MRHSHNRYRAPTRGLHPTYRPTIFGPARPGIVPGHVAFLVLTVMCVFFLCLFLWTAVCTSAQLITPPPETPISETNWPNPYLGNSLLCVGWPCTKVIDNCRSFLFRKWTSHDPGLCHLGCPLPAVNAECGDHLKISPFAFQPQDTLLHLLMWSPHTVSVAPNGLSGQTLLCLPVTRYNLTIKDTIEKMAVVLEFILCQATLVTYDLFLHLALIVHEGLPHSARRRRGRKATSLSGHRRHSHQKTCDVLCTLACRLSTLTIVCISGGMRYKCRAVFKQLCSLLVKFPSLKLRRGLKCARRVHGHLVMSFTIPRSCVSHIRFKDSSSCLAFIRHLALLVKMLAPVVKLHPHFFLRTLLLLAGDVEVNPGPILAEVVLDCFRKQFIAEMDANAVIYELLQRGIIDGGDQKEISMTNDPKQQNEMLHLCLTKKCTDDALKIVCDVIIGVKGNPKMKALAEAMKGKLETGPDKGSALLTSVDDYEKELRRFSDNLRKHYAKMNVVEDRYRRHQEMEYINLVLSKFKLDIEDDHRQLVCSLTEGVDKVFTELKGKVEYEDIPRLMKRNQLVVISGAPGTGKSTLAKKLCKDASRDMESLGYKLVVMVELRDLVPLTCLQQSSSFELEHLMELFEQVGHMESVVQMMKATCGADMLLILDGYDELPHELRHSPFFIDLLTHSLKSPLPHSHVILTSRSIVTSEIYHHFESTKTPFANIEVLGFTSEQIQLYIESYFREEGKSELSANLCAKLETLPQIKGLCAIPVVLSIISRVFLSKKDLPSTLTQIYDDFICETLTPMFPGLQSALKLPCQDHDFLELCEIAYRCTKQQKMIFTTSDLKGLQGKYSNRETGCNLLTARPIDKLRFVIAESFYFIHLTVQEFLSAVYIALQEVTVQCAIWDEHLGKLHMAQTWRFYSGLSKLAHYDLLQNSNIRGFKNFDELLMQSLFETQDTALVGRLVPNALGEEVEVSPKTNYDSMAFGYCLRNHSLLQDLMVDLPGGGVHAEVKRLLEPVLCSRQLQTLTIHGGGSDSKNWRDVDGLLQNIMFQESINCDGAMKEHFGKVYLEAPPLSTVVKLLCLQHVTEIRCEHIQDCKAIDHEVLMEMERSLSGNNSMNKLTLDSSSVTLPEQFCHYLLLGIRRNSSLSDIDLSFKLQSWDCPDNVPAGDQGSIQHFTLCGVPVDVLAKMFSLFSTIKEMKCHVICPPKETMDHEVLTEMERSLTGNKTMNKLTLSDTVRSVTLPKQFCHHLLLGIRRNSSLTDVDLSFNSQNWDCPDHVPAGDQGSIQHLTLKYVPVDMLAKMFSLFGTIKELECYDIHPPEKAMDHEVLMEMERTLSGSKAMNKLTLSDCSGVTLSKQFCIHLLLGIGRNSSLSDVDLSFDSQNWDCPDDVPTGDQGSIQCLTLWHVPVDVLAKMFTLFSTVKELKCQRICPAQTICQEVLMEMERSLSGNKIMSKLTLNGSSLPKQFCRHLLLGIRRNSSLSDVDLSFHPQSWDCPINMPVGDQVSIQRLTLCGVPMDVLASMFILNLFSTIKRLECCDIHPPNEELKLNEMEQALAGMSELETLVLGMSGQVPNSLMLELGEYVLKGISQSTSIGDFVLNDGGKRKKLLNEMLARLADASNNFTIGQYQPGILECYPCIRLSPSTFPAPQSDLTGPLPIAQSERPGACCPCCTL